MFTVIKFRISSVNMECYIYRLYDIHDRGWIQMTFYIETKEARIRFENELQRGGTVFTKEQIDLLGNAFDRGIRSLAVNITEEIAELHQLG